MPPLDGKAVVVTGASRGIGLAIAQALAREGAKVVAVGRIRKALERSTRKLPGAAVAVRADVTRPAQLRRLFQIVGRRFGCLDILVNNAGVFTYKAFDRTTLEDWRKNIETNLTAVFLTTRAALPLLERSRQPHLVNILSISSVQAFPKCSAYCASKFGALGLTRVLREELRRRRIRVTAILPGPTDTRLVDEFDFPVERARLIQPADVAEAVLAALAQPPRASVEEIVLMPSRGRL